jgi:uncharacterized protein (DUF2147 family)
MELFIKERFLIPNKPRTNTLSNANLKTLMKQFLFILLFTTVGFSAFSQNKDAVLGEWVNATGEAHVDIYKKNSKYFGKIVWLKNPTNEAGGTKMDVKNPNESLQSKPVQGLEILKDFVFDGEKWTDGSIYDPKSGKTYSCNITLKKDGNLNIRGYIGLSIIGRSEVWKKLK